MPKSTMHLWIAKKVAERLKYDAGASYLLGSIAPDATSNRTDKSKKDKHIAHLRQPDFKSGYKNAQGILADHGDNEFLKGCALHIMLDDLWIMGPYYTMMKSLRDKMPEKQAKIYYLRDLEYIESWLFRQNSSRTLWSAVMSAPLERYFDIFTAGEIEDFRKARHAHLSDLKSIAPSKYITLDIVYTFMDTAAEKLANELLKA